MPQGPAAHEGPSTILLVDDEPAVRYVARSALEMAGHVVLEASDGEEAVRVAEQTAGPIHILLTDLVMPGMTGDVLAAALRTRWPGLKVVFTSGYMRDRAPHLADGAFIPKPYSLADLWAKVQEVLAR